jgi:hypothetical protein
MIRFPLPSPYPRMSEFEGSLLSLLLVAKVSPITFASSLRNRKKTNLEKGEAKPRRQQGRLTETIQTGKTRLRL